MSNPKIPNRLAEKEPVITIVAAMNCEIKPIVDRLRLLKQCDKPFAVYKGEMHSHNIEVIVSGIGAVAMAASVGWIAAQRPTAQRVWLNVGTAGHQTADLGMAFRVHASADIFSERKHHVAMVAKSALATDQLLSINAPSNDYPDVGGIDMEAFAYFSAAYKFSSAELVESIKVVSDSPKHDIADLNAAKISELIVPHVDNILSLALAMHALLSPQFEAANLTLPELRATHSQRHQLGVLIAKLTALKAIDDDLILAVNKSQDIQNLLTLLNTRLTEIEPCIEGVGHG